jgi:outer membrane receptor for Fe3+-dicitrate
VQLYQEIIDLYQKSAMHIKVRFKKFGSHIFYLIIFLIIFQQNIHASQDKTEDLNLDSVFNMSMKEMLQVVVTTAGKKEEKIADTPASVVIISRKDIERFGFSSLEEILDNVPGMFKINDMSGYKPIFGVRGFLGGDSKKYYFFN